ncbi:MAG: replicative DNA helicase [bacterium]|nr:replicative DNA helicase [bacterium]
MRELRLPPQSKEAEEAILGALLMDRNAIHRAMEMLEPEHFYQPRHAEIFRAMVTLYSRGEAVDIVTLSEALKKMDKLEVAGGTSYLGGLQESVATGAHVEHYARIVLEKATLRQMISISGEIVDSCFAGREDAMDILDEAESSILSISQGRLKQGFQSSSQLLKETFVMIQKLQDNPESLTGIPSGFAELDKLTGGFQNSDLVIIAGRPSMGKTAFALNLVQNAAIEHKKNVAVFSLEMSNEQLMLRMLTCESRVDAHKLRSGQLREDDWRLLTDAANQLAQSQIFIDDTPAITVLEMRAKCRRLQSQQGLDMIIIDYLQLARGGSKSDNRQQEISEISRGLKGLAKELNVPVLALSQLSRALEARQDKRPMLSDLRESGAIEQDADVVMFVYRPEVYDKENDELEGLSEIIIGKQRNGPIGTAHLAFVKNYTRFEELAHVPFYD